MPEGWVKVKKAAQYAGISERTLWTWLSSGLPYARVGGTALVSYKDLDTYIRKHTVNRNEVQEIVEDVLRTLRKGG